MANRNGNDAASLFTAARGRDRAALARLISLVERGGAPSRDVAREAYRTPGVAYTVGITGAPGAGKSTLTDRLIAAGRVRGLTGSAGDGAGGGEGNIPVGDPGGGGDGGGDGAGGEGFAIGVLAIDPSSPYSGGAILGDRVRMQNHALDDGMYIRSMATRGHLGGLAVAVPDAVRVLSAVGLDVVLVETVGVGQQELEVASATDTTVVVVNPGWGDSIQANKAGLMEIADLFVINKADRPNAAETRRDLELMLDLTTLGDWRPPIVETVASTGAGTDELWSAVNDHRSFLEERGLLAVRRRQRLERELQQIVLAEVGRRIGQAEQGGGYAELTGALADGSIDPYEAADRLLDRIIGPGA